MKLAKRYIYPPRPIHDPVPIDKIGMYAKYSWKAQLKYNDKRTEISVNNNEVELFNRHKSKHKTFTLTTELHNELLTVLRDVLGLDVSQWSYVDGGLLDGKNKNIAGLIVIWDILVREGDWLIGSTYGERYKWLLDKAVAAGGQPFMVEVNGQKFDFGIKLSEHVFLPRVFENYETAWELVFAVNKAAKWNGIGDGEPLLEGCILKDPDGVLKPDNGKEENNTTWSARSRVRTGRHRQ
jgi:hypothetical protein